MDIAAAKGLSLQTVTKAMEKAYGGNMTALAKLSPELRQMIKDGATLEEVMQEMSKTFGGAATDSANTAAGSMKRLGVALGEAKEGIGAALLPILEKALPVLQSFATWAQDNPKFITAVAVAFGALAASIVLVNAAMALNPAVLITAGIVALGAALVMAYRKFDTFRAVVNAVINHIAGNFEFMANAFIKTINVLIRGINIINPGKDVAKLAEQSFGRIGSGDSGGAFTSARAFEESQKMSSVVATVDETNFDSAIAAGITSAKVKPTKAPEIFDNTSGNAGGFATAGIGGIGPFANLTVNVNGGDPNAVVLALQNYVRSNGPVPINTRAM